MNPSITREEIESRIRTKSPLVLVEALPPSSYEQGHLPGAINLPLDRLAQAAALLPDRDAELVVYCAGPTCKNSDTAREKLESLGYSRVRVFHGGKSEWTAAGNALEVSDGNR